MPTPRSVLFPTVVALAATAVAQTGWMQLQPAGQPPPRGHHAMVYDLTRNTTVMFGGWQGIPLADTWEWNGASWAQRVTLNSPSARFGHGLASDLGRGRVVLFGGACCSLNGDMNDTWEYDGNNWVQVQPANQNRPVVRRFARMQYDVIRARTILFGGGMSNHGFPALYDTWEWDGVVWTQRLPAMSPPARWAHGMTYDFVRGRIVLFGGSPGNTTIFFSDTWTWDGTNWSPVPTVGATATTALGLVSDPARDLVVRFGGAATGHETWLFDHVAWRRDGRTPSPSSRSWCALAHDVLRGRTVMFGGFALAPLGDTWEYDPGAVARWTPFGSGCPGTSGVPHLQPVSFALPIVGTTFELELLAVPSNAAAISIGFSNLQWSGSPLPFDLGVLGMTGCTLHSSPDFLFFAPVVGGRATLAWTLPNDPGLVGMRFFNQGFVLDPGINPLGAVVSNAGAGVIGPF